MATFDCFKFFKKEIFTKFNFEDKICSWEKVINRNKAYQYRKKSQ